MIRLAAHALRALACLVAAMLASSHFWPLLR